MEACVNHPQHAAIERCEVCGKALCGLCLWYAGDGRRLCEADAREAYRGGISITPPEEYAAGVVLTRPSSQESASAPYRGNRVDVLALIGAVLGGVILAGCSGLSACLPLVTAILGGYAYANANRAQDPRRARLLGALALGGSALLFLVIIGFLAFFLTSFFVALASAGGP